MTKKDLIKIIREVVKREIKSVVKNEINEALTLMEGSSKKPPIRNKVNKERQYTSNTMLNEVLNSTMADNEEWPEISQGDIRNRFTQMQGATPQVDINNNPVDVSNLEQSVSKALTRDYSELVKRFNK